MSYKIPIFVMILSAAYALAACDRSKSAAQVTKDTNAARQTAADNVAKAQQQADERIASARGEVRDEQRDLAPVDAVENQKVADSEAAGDYKVALARCERVGGDLQKACKDQADADYQMAKAKAKQVRAGADPKP